MKIHLVSTYDNSVPSVVVEKIKNDCYQALGGVTANSPSQFIINPTIWYNMAITKKGVMDPKPRVMNSADYISKKFLNTLEDIGWTAGSQEKTINEQRIDGYIEIETSLPFYKISEDSFINFFNECRSTQGIYNEQKNLKANFNSFYVRYCSSSWFMIDKLPKNLKKYFKQTEQRKIKVGLEFETGNIASSFRAFSKIDYLFNEGLIDLGVFLTSIDKATTAGKIWPISNRNGSFEELMNRNYKAGITIPLLEIGFQPDELDENAKYLGSDGGLFEPSKTDEIARVDDRTLQKYIVNNSPCWKIIK